MDQQQTAASLDQSIGEGPTVSQEPNTAAQGNSFWWDLLFWVTMCIPVWVELFAVRRASLDCDDVPADDIFNTPSAMSVSTKAAACRIHVAWSRRASLAIVGIAWFSVATCATWKGPARVRPFCHFRCNFKVVGEVGVPPFRSIKDLACPTVPNTGTARKRQFPKLSNLPGG